jgi:predicted acyl esterase
VRIEIRQRHGVATEREEAEWPLARTEYRKLYLDLAEGKLADEAPASEAQSGYDATNGRATLDHTFAEATEFTGYASLTLWVEADGSDDIDLFVALQKLDREGQVVGFTFYGFYENGPVALGWLRASHRGLDRARSTPAQPVHLHTREELLSPGEVVELEVELWPFSVRFESGESLRLVIAGADIYRPEDGAMLPFPLHEQTRNAGTHVLHSGGTYGSFLTLPSIPGPGDGSRPGS